MVLGDRVIYRSAQAKGGDCGQEGYHTSCVDTRSGDRAERLRFKDGDGLDRAAAASAPDGCASAATRTLCGPSGPAEVRLQEEGDAQGQAPRAAAREKGNNDIGTNDRSEPLIDIRLVCLRKGAALRVAPFFARVPPRQV